MPEIGSPIHVRMLERSRQRGETETGAYGLCWGDPERLSSLGHVRDHWCAPFVKPTSTILEIGPGGGRWTRYMLGCRHLYAVDFHQELLDELAAKFRVEHLSFIKNDGDNLPGIDNDSIDFAFTFGVFVHLELHTIDAYMAEIFRVLKPGGDAVIQFSDKSKPQGRDNPSFSDNSPSKMRRMAIDQGFIILAENVTLLPNAGMMHLTKRDDAEMLKNQTYSDA